ncbi:MAG: Gfo/Idh/MocA family oxidoreductase [Opitutaceae bacterium]|nr:Gfo/Idh/MocA family oxidoreductase [Opitutaceae bacterium]
MNTHPSKGETGMSRRQFLRDSALVGAAALAASPAARAAAVKGTPIPGFEPAATGADASKGWVPVSDRKIRVGIVGYGVCKFGAAFGFQDHPNVEVVAVSDLFPDRCAALAKACRCSKTYPSLEELVKDDRIEAVFIATDAASHARHALEVLKHGKHVATAVPAVWGSVEDAEKLFQAVKSSGRKYMMFETSCFHEDLYAMHQIYQAGGFGEIVYTEGEYFHYAPTPMEAYKEWRTGSPPQWYVTHASAYHIGVTGRPFTEVSCLGMLSNVPHLQAKNNRYRNPFGTEVALYRTSEGGMARIMVSKDTQGLGAEKGRLRGQKGSFYDGYVGEMKKLPPTQRPPLPPNVARGGHGGAHGYLTNEFVTAVLQDRDPWINIAMALNMTVCGVVAHQSALKGGELMKIPQYKM